MPRHKQPRARQEPNTTKTARSKEVGTQGATPVWSFALCDFGGPWCFSGVRGPEARNLVERLYEFQRMTWGEIEGDRHHFLDPETLSPAAVSRLTQIGQDDAQDVLFSLALGGEPRLVGVRRGQTFYVLWWDPHHEVCPSHKKHT